MTLISGLFVVAFGLYMIGLSALCIARPERARRFLQLFASTPRAHYIEQATRLVAGAALVLFSPSMWYSFLFEVFGWIIVVTAVGLLLIPWRWHHRFAEWVVPMALRYLKVFAVSAFGLGAFVLYGASRFVLG